ncbi:MAG: arsenate reductase (glutaredoxin) [Candidatus Cloacimonetes bacterium]|nr:arsenate reductase (glutaredoxin) [Candidatus Cloacimonadota bacterium]
MLSIYHNPRCSKSRLSLQVLEESGLDFKVKKYLEDGLTKPEVDTILSSLGCEPIEIFRTKEKEFKDHNLTKSSSKEDLVKALLAAPKLLERPIVLNEKSGVIGRPVENTQNFVSNLV